MQSLQLVSRSENLRQNTIASQTILDGARASAAENLLNSGQISASLNKISLCLEKLVGSCHIQVLSFNAEDNCFRLINQTDRTHQDLVANITLHTVNNLQTGIHQRLRSLKVTVCEDIHQAKAWRNVHLQSKELGVVSAWVIPIVCKENKLCGAYICLFNTMRQINEGDQALLDRAAFSVSSILFHGKQKTITLKQKISMEKQLAKNKADLSETKAGLLKALSQRKDVQEQLVEFEHLAALGTMMSSLTHEINTPIGVSLTASSYLHDLQQEYLQKLEENQLKRSELKHYFQEISEASFIIQRNVMRAAELIQTFKRLAVDQDSQEQRDFNICDYVYELLLSLKPRLKFTPHKFCIDIPAEIIVCSQPGAFGQVFTNLIMNSIHHAFLPKHMGRITIKARLNDNNNLTVNYKDNGIGISEDTLREIYKPFFSQTTHSDSTGLGLHICNNLVSKSLKGSLKCHSAIGKGTEFIINIPV